MRTISAEAVTDAVARLCIRANCHLPQDIRAALQSAHADEPSPMAKDTLALILENDRIAASEPMPICQDTGMACVFVRLGQQLHIDGDLSEAIVQGVRRGYREGYLRCSVVADPLRRTNTGDNTPPIIHYDLVPGDRLELTVAPKGFGSENMSALRMLRPSDGREGVIDFVLDTVRRAGPNACPPMVVGVGIGGTFDHAAHLAKRALLRPLSEPNRDAYYALLEQELLQRINALGIGPQGLGGSTTALGVRIEQCPTHIAGLPVAVNIGCHVTRRCTEVL